MKIVLDNNVLISGIFWKGPPHKIIEITEKGKIQICSSIEILKELFGVLRREKFKPYFEEAGTTREEVLQNVIEMVEIYTPGTKVEAVQKDPGDNKFLECALSCRASFIVSGGNHLLELKEFQEIPIVTPKEFLRKLK